MDRFRRALAVPIVGLILWSMLGCMTADSGQPAPRVRFHLENAHATSRGGIVPIQMPVSGIEVVVNRLPVLMEEDLVNVELVEVELGQCLLFEFSRVGSRALYEVTATKQGNRLLLMVDGVPVGLRVIDGPVATGQWLTFTELTPETEADLVVRLREHLYARR